MWVNHHLGGNAHIVADHRKIPKQRLGQEILAGYHGYSGGQFCPQELRSSG